MVEALGHKLATHHPVIEPVSEIRVRNGIFRCNHSDTTDHIWKSLCFCWGGTGPFNSWSQRKDELHRKLGDVPSWVIHDIRRTARSLMSRAGVRRDIAERVLGHAIVGVEGVYDRYHYDEQKAVACSPD
jgi:hypothetical protein